MEPKGTCKLCNTVVYPTDRHQACECATAPLLCHTACGEEDAASARRAIRLVCAKCAKGALFEYNYSVKLATSVVRWLAYAVLFCLVSFVAGFLFVRFRCTSPTCRYSVRANGFQRTCFMYGCAITGVVLTLGLLLRMGARMVSWCCCGRGSARRRFQ
jgi:hypothetical protein